MLQYFIQTGESMKQTEVVRYLIEALKEASLITYNKDFLDYIGISTDPVHIKRLSDYMHRSGSIRDPELLKAIEEKFGFDKSIWKRNDEYQTVCIKESIENELDLQQLPNEEALDISTILHTKKPITKEQLDLLDAYSMLTDKHKEEEMIDQFLNMGLLSKKVANQEFLVELLKLTYKKGLYLIIVEFILPNLYRRYLLLGEVQKIEAHTRGSLGEYDEAKHILNVLIHHNTIENINLQTSALSNHKREILQASRSVDAEELYTLIEGYQELHAIKGIYSYYTGINLLYMVVLGQILFPHDQRFHSIDTKAIYDHSKPSLKNDKTHETYYSVMSDFEFKLLLGYEAVLERIESFLANKEPHISLVERTSRQIHLFISSIEKSRDPRVSLFQKAENILNGYIYN